MNIIKECPNPEFDLFFEGDFFNDGDLCNTLFILTEYRYYRDYHGLNSDQYKDIVNKVTGLLVDMEYKPGCQSYKQIMQDYGIPYSPAKCHQLKKWAASNPDPSRPYDIACYLSIVTGKEWDTMEVHGYCQGDWCIVLYCKERCSNPEYYGELWLGCGKEFSIQLDGDDTEVFGYYVADCQVNCDEDYKAVLCEMEGLDPAETQVELISNTYTTTNYDYKVI